MTVSIDLKKKDINLSFFLLIAFFSFWLIPRFPAIYHNVLSLDDFTILNGMGHFAHLDHYRPTMFLSNQLLDFIIPGETYATNIPKIVAGFYLSGFNLVLYKILKKWGISSPLCFLIVNLLLLHPIINEITLWNAVQSSSLIMLLVTSAYRVIQININMMRLVLSISLLTLGLLGYQPYIGIYFALVITGFFVGVVSKVKHSTLKLLSFQILVMFIAIIFYFLYAEVISKYLMGIESHRGAIGSPIGQEYLVTKLKGEINLFINLIVPILSFYTNVYFAFQKWEIIPIILFFMIFVAGIASGLKFTMNTITSFSMSALPLLVLAPIWVIEETPAAWRISVSSLVALMLEISFLILLLQNLNKNKKAIKMKQLFVITALTIIIILVLPVTYHDAQRRVKAFRDDKKIVEEIKSYWENNYGHQKIFRVGIFHLPHKVDNRDIQSLHELTSGYKIKLPESAFGNKYFAGISFLQRNDMEIVLFPPHEKAISKLIYGCGFELNSSSNSFKKLTQKKKKNNPLCSFIKSNHIEKTPVINDSKLINSVENNCYSLSNDTELMAPRKVIHYPEFNLSVICSYPNLI